MSTQTHSSKEIAINLLGFSSSNLLKSSGLCLLICFIFPNTADLKRDKNSRWQNSATSLISIKLDRISFSFGASTSEPELGTAQPQLVYNNDNANKPPFYVHGTLLDPHQEELHKRAAFQTHNP